MTFKTRRILGIILALNIVTSFGLAQNPVAIPEKGFAVSPERALATRLIATRSWSETEVLLKENSALRTTQLIDCLLAEGEKLTDENEKRRTFEMALKLAEDLGANELAGRALVKIGMLEPRRNDEIADYVRAMTFADKLSDKKLLASIYGRIGNAYTQKGDFTTARSYHAKSLEIKQVIGDLDGVSISLSNIGLIDQMQGDLRSALKNFHESIAISNSLGTKEGVAIDSFNLGNVYREMGDYAQALASYFNSLTIGEEIKSEHSIFGATINIANLYNAQGSHELAREYLKRATKVNDENALPQLALGGLADSYVGDGRYDDAVRTYLRLLSLKEGSSNPTPYSVAETLINIGDLYLQSGDPVRAETYFDRVLSMGQGDLGDVWTFRALTGKTKARVARGDLEGALELGGRALEHFQKLKDIKESWGLHLAIGIALAGRGRFDLSRSSLEKAITVIEQTRRQTAGSPKELHGFLNEKISAYRAMIALLSSKQLQTEALIYAERAKAGTLVELLASSRQPVDRAMSNDERAAQQRLRNELVAAGIQLDNAKRDKGEVPIRIRELEAGLSKKRLEFEDFQNRIYVAHPELRAQRGEMKPISLEDTSGIMTDANSVIMEFVVAEDKVFVFVITKNAANRPVVKTVTVDVKANELSKTLEAYRGKLADGDLDFQKASRELYDLLLKPAEKELAGKTNVIIVPDGPLWDLPFQALMDEKGKYLVEKAAVSYAPSLTALREMRKKALTRKPSPQAELLAFGNPIVAKETSERVQRVFMNEKLEPLPEAERLVNELGKMYGPTRSKIFTGNAAREETAKTEAPKYRIVQFATHGILNNVSPMYSHLVMSQDAKNPNEDGLLEAWELKDLDLKADMVILTACETARGKISNGEGMIGMTWASFIAGAPTTVASQWKVESRSTTELMLEFHRQLLGKQKLSKAEALRRASLKLMKMPQYRHPSYWAGFVLVGDGS